MGSDHGLSAHRHCHDWTIGYQPCAMCNSLEPHEVKTSFMKSGESAPWEFNHELWPLDHRKPGAMLSTDHPLPLAMLTWRSLRRHNGFAIKPRVVGAWMFVVGRKLGSWIMIPILELATARLTRRCRRLSTFTCNDSVFCWIGQAYWDAIKHHATQSNHMQSNKNRKKGRWKLCSVIESSRHSGTFPAWECKFGHGREVN